MTLPAGNRIWGNNKGRTNANRDTLLSVPSLDFIVPFPFVVKGRIW